jgi:hypothetical protein
MMEGVLKLKPKSRDFDLDEQTLASLDEGSILHGGEATGRAVSSRRKWPVFPGPHDCKLHWSLRTNCVSHCVNILASGF